MAERVQRDSVASDQRGDTRWFQPGEPVLLRYRRNYPAEGVVPVTIVEDTGGRIMFYTAEGTPIKVRHTAEGAPLGRTIPFAERERMPVVLGDAVWHTANLLTITESGRASSVGLFWAAIDWRFLGYYPNLQAPLRRTLLGFDTADFLLDITIEPDLSWQWKDEDEFTIAQEMGIFTPEQAAAIRAEGERIIADVEARRPPFDGSYERWRPEPSWTQPTMPAGWDRD